MSADIVDLPAKQMTQEYPCSGCGGETNFFSFSRARVANCHHCGMEAPAKGWMERCPDCRGDRYAFDGGFKHCRGCVLLATERASNRNDSNVVSIGKP